MDELNDLEKIIRVLFAAYPNAKISRENMAAYKLAFADADLRELALTVRQILKEPGDFVPPPGNVLERLREARGGPTASRAPQAWLEVLESLKTYPAAPLSDPIAALAVKSLGGISNIRRSENPDMDRAHFYKAYADFANTAARNAREDNDFKQLGSNIPQLKGD